MLARKAKQDKNSRTSIHTVEPDDHYPLTCTPENGVWMLGNLNAMPFSPFAWKRSEELESYDLCKKSMSMISWSRKGTQAS